MPPSTQAITEEIPVAEPSTPTPETTTPRVTSTLTVNLPIGQPKPIPRFAIKLNLTNKRVPRYRANSLISSESNLNLIRRKTTSNESNNSESNEVKSSNGKLNIIVNSHVKKKSTSSDLVQNDKQYENKQYESNNTSNSNFLLPTPISSLPVQSVPVPRPPAGPSLLDNPGDDLLLHIEPTTNCPKSLLSPMAASVITQMECLAKAQAKKQLQQNNGHGKIELESHNGYRRYFRKYLLSLRECKHALLLPTGLPNIPELLPTAKRPVVESNSGKNGHNHGQGHHGQGQHGQGNHGQNQHGHGHANGQHGHAQGYHNHSHGNYGSNLPSHIQDDMVHHQHHAHGHGKKNKKKMNKQALVY